MNLHNDVLNDDSLLTASLNNGVRQSMAITWEEIVKAILNNELFQGFYVY